MLKMQSVKNKITSESQLVYAQVQTKNKRIMFGVIVFFVVYMIIQTVFDIFAHRKDHFYFIMILSILNFIVEMYLFNVFLSLYFSFIELMEKKLAFENSKMTNFNKLMCYWTLILALLTLAHCIVALLNGITIDKSIHAVEVTFERIVVPIKDILVYTTILYLFYYQATQLSRNSKNQITGGTLRQKMTFEDALKGSH